MSSNEVTVIKADGTKTTFKPEKLEASLRRAGASDEVARQVLNHVASELEDGMTTQEIHNHAVHVLHKLEIRAATRYSLRRAVLDFGPSGFAFEKLVAEIWKHRGYKTLTDQTVNGFCVEHEIDVVAWKASSAGQPGDLEMVEAKFHNQPGLKSDLKVMLYVKSRIDDLSRTKFVYDDQEYLLTNGWLVTNTKFTISAIKYAECQNMNVVGWNYPLDNNLHDLIEEAGLQPITLLKTLSEHEKKDLLARGIVICKDLEEKPEILKSLNLPAANSEAVLSEIKKIYAGTTSLGELLPEKAKGV